MKKIKFDPFKNLKLDAYEQEIEDSLKKGEWVPVSDQQKKALQASARYTLDLLKKKKNINIRIQEMTLRRLKEKAAAEGLPYQTLVGSILHKYAHGTL
jgi:predicted DNA binding CopG/RHH family protein